ncbi:pterin 4 alpha carbinolamine dehydratase-domain-containing protein [Nemania sp. FL0916]|nr:pterin 4 alpha carbinolamine dehydratase-domain-containing protein [Nemania sp. FL0916]
MLVLHASLRRNALMSRGTTIQILRAARQAGNELRSQSTISRRTQPYRFQSSSSVQTMASNNEKVKFSAGANESALSTALRVLLDSAGEGGRWALVPGGDGLERSFKFKNFAKTWDFMTAVSLQCKLKNHHPEWSNVYNTTYIRWTTHSPAGLSAKDVELAGLCDALARDFGEVLDGRDAAAQTSDLKAVADRVASAAGDCCVPKKP